MAPNQAIAKFTFEGEQAGDLSFKKGEIITIVKRTENETDWWTGKIGDREGIFPRFVCSVEFKHITKIDRNNSNYIETV